MKIGYRKPSIKKSFKAKITENFKRIVKRGINPTYGTKGSGLLKNPKKSIHNKVYSLITIDSLSEIRKTSKQISKPNNNYNFCDDSSVCEDKFKNEIHKNRKEILETRKNTSKESNTYYFSVKASCCRCNKDLGLHTFRSRIQLVDGWLCMKCAKKIFKLNELQRKAYSVSEINEMFKDK